VQEKSRSQRSNGQESPPKFEPNEFYERLLVMRRSASAIRKEHQHRHTTMH
jgi:hypothetical protein